MQLTSSSCSSCPRDHPHVLSVELPLGPDSTTAGAGRHERETALQIEMLRETDLRDGKGSFPTARNSSQFVPDESSPTCSIARISSVSLQSLSTDCRPPISYSETMASRQASLARPAVTLTEPDRHHYGLLNCWTVDGPDHERAARAHPHFTCRGAGHPPAPIFPAATRSLSTKVGGNHLHMRPVQTWCMAGQCQGVS